ALTAPVAAVLPVLELKPAPESACGKLLADVRQRPIAPPPGQTYHSKKPGRTPEGDLKSTQPDSGTTAAPQRRAGPPSREPLTTGG
ncbi:hypothetical protein, partial [Klebsiella pneumoniae]|uniref:hypothetical protein n=1 Tax=Klebsiella pneumoniae TaxID=573 RepID=UPI000CC2639C